MGFRFISLNLLSFLKKNVGVWGSQAVSVSPVSTFELVDQFSLNLLWTSCYWSPYQPYVVGTCYTMDSHIPLLWSYLSK
jgi:hypothetical protein